MAEYTTPRELVSKIRDLEVARTNIETLYAINELTSLPKAVWGKFKESLPARPRLSAKLNELQEWVQSDAAREELHQFNQTYLKDTVKLEDVRPEDYKALRADEQWEKEHPVEAAHKRRKAQNKRKRNAFVLAGLLGVGMAVAGCVGDDEDDDHGLVDIASTAETYVTPLEGGQHYVGFFMDSGEQWHVFYEGSPNDITGFYKVKNGTDQPEEIFVREEGKHQIYNPDMSGGHLGWELTEDTNDVGVGAVSHIEHIVNYDLKADELHLVESQREEIVNNDDIKHIAINGVHSVYALRGGDAWDIIEEDLDGNQRIVKQDFDLSSYQADANIGGSIVGLAQNGKVYVWQDDGSGNYNETELDGNLVKFSGGEGGIVTDEGVKKFRLDDLANLELIPDTQGTVDFELLEHYMVTEDGNGNLYLHVEGEDRALLYDSQITDIWFDKVKENLLAVGGTFGDDIGQVQFNE